MECLDAETWRARQAAHEARVDGLTAGHRDRKARGEKHPVEDFLFTYYSQRPGRLRRWSPGPGVELEGGPSDDPWLPTGRGAVLAPPTARVVERARWTADLLARTAARPARFGCFGMHEWAMVYRQDPTQVRHPVPLRLGPAGTDAVVESQPIACTHFDAFRFFTPEARPRNALQPTRESRLTGEQGGCLHANMDLYAHASALSPWVPSELVADCFDLARRVRVLDMRASPYDLSDLGLEPVAVETEAGRQDYAGQQRAFAAEAASLRTRLAGAVEVLRARASA